MVNILSNPLCPLYAGPRSPLKIHVPKITKFIFVRNVFKPVLIGFCINCQELRLPNCHCDFLIPTTQLIMDSRDEKS